MARLRWKSRSVWRGVLAVAGALVLIFLVYGLYLDHVVTSKFEGRRWTLPAQVYAAPLELYAGLPLSNVQIEHELQRLNSWLNAN